MKAGVFDGLQIRTFIRNKDFICTMNVTEEAARQSSLDNLKKVLRNRKAPSYETLVYKIFSGFHDYDVIGA